ncbi:hypothetical protein ElyMa_003220800 [Elysia marginata]|uniref:Uncharacterized protein n=1 Tax=Elysia marginata TaxID=1093978 RepID=A0AAV4J3Z9_9GAST|nr:hypothetical protein ElyMa_003220800 [Elysia marginata]
MSAEAQFALLKGYEDILAEKLVDQFPSERALIQRTKTPRHSIAISELGHESHRAKPWAEKRRSWGGLMFKDDKTELERLGEIDNGVNDGQTADLYSTKFKDDFESASKVFEKVSSVEQDDFQPGLERRISTSSQYSNKQTSSSNNTDMLTNDQSNARNKLSDKNTHNLSTEDTPQDPISHSPSNYSDEINVSASNAGTPLSKTNQSTPQGLQNTTPKEQTGLSKQLHGRRGSSLPEVVSSPRQISRHLTRDRLLMMTHRIEKAMDILDALRPGTELALSPRVKGGVISEKDQRHQHKQRLHFRPSERRHSEAAGAEPLRDFNRWAGQWSLEFRADSTS